MLASELGWAGTTWNKDREASLQGLAQAAHRTKFRAVLPGLVAERAALINKLNEKSLTWADVPLGVQSLKVTK